MESPGTPTKTSLDIIQNSANMFSEKKYNEILEKSKEKKRYLPPEVEEVLTEEHKSESEVSSNS